LQVGGFTKPQAFDIKEACGFAYGSIYGYETSGRQI
jgi:hypothetical protein